MSNTSSFYRPYIGSHHHRFYIDRRSKSNFFRLGDVKIKRQMNLSSNVDRSNFVLQLKTDEFDENEFRWTADVSRHELVVDAEHREEDFNGGFIYRQLHKIFSIPSDVDLNPIFFSYNKIQRELTIALPFRDQSKTLQIETTDKSRLLLSLDLQDYQPEEIKVSVKDRELIVQAEKKLHEHSKTSRSSFYQSTRLPLQTDIEHLQSNYLDGKLIIEAPFLDQRSTTFKSNR